MNFRAILSLALIGATIFWSIPTHGSFSLAQDWSDRQPAGEFPLEDSPLDQNKDSEGWESELDDCESRLAFDTRMSSLPGFSGLMSRLSRASKPHTVTDHSSAEFARGPPTA